MNPGLFLVFALAGAAGLVLLLRRAALPSDSIGIAAARMDTAGMNARPVFTEPGLLDQAGDALSATADALSGFIADTVTAVRSTFQLPASAEPYREAITRAERAQGLPEGLLGRVLYQESRFRQDIISGRTVSPAGAVGIAQIVPKWHPGVDPRDPFQSIEYAAGYLRRLFDRFGNWTEALAAYNWGQGNQANKDRADNIIGNDWPRETQAYVRDILADVNVGS